MVILLSRLRSYLATDRQKLGGLFLNYCYVSCQAISSPGKT